MSATKIPAIERILNSAELYERNLLNKNILIIGCRDDDVTYLEIRFLARNFKHLTGVRTVSKDLSAMQFWRMCAGHKLSIRDISPDWKGTAGQKLKVAPHMFAADLSASEFGRANRSRLYVSAKVFAGDRQACLGFNEDGTDYLYPETLLMSPIRNEAGRKDLHRVIGVYSKPIKSRWYDCATKIDADADWDNVLHSLPYRLQHVTTITP
jgi:hypothetical protein